MTYQSNENVDGMALHKDLSFTDYKWTQPDSFTYKGVTYRSKSFADIYIRTLELLIRDYPREMAQLPEKYVWFKYELSGSTGSKQLSNGIYAGMNYHRYDFAKFLQKIFDDLGLPRDTMFIDSHRDYQGYTHSQRRINESVKTEKTVLRLNDDWMYKRPLSYTLRGKNTSLMSTKWTDMYIAVLEDLIKINTLRMRNLPNFDAKCFSYIDVPGVRFKVLSNNIRAVISLQANQIKEELSRLLAYLDIPQSDFQIQAEKESFEQFQQHSISENEPTVVNEEKYKSLPTEEGFYEYLKNGKKLSESSCQVFMSSIRSAEKFAKKNNYSNTTLFADNLAEAEMTYKELTGDPVFQALDREKRFRFSNALSKLMTFYRSIES